MTSVLKVDNIQNSSGTSALSVDSSGNVTATTYVKQSAVPAFRLEVDAQSFTSSGTKDVLLDTAVDSAGTNGRRFMQGGIALANSNSRVSVPVTGVYQFNINCRVDGIGSGYIVFYLKHNDSFTSDSYHIEGTPSTSYQGVNLSTVFYLEAGDTVGSEIYASADTSWSIVASAGFFSGHLIG